MILLLQDVEFQHVEIAVPILEFDGVRSILCQV